jgi:hypothetical protein
MPDNIRRRYVARMMAQKEAEKQQINDVKSRQR